MTEPKHSQIIDFSLTHLQYMSMSELLLLTFIFLDQLYHHLLFQCSPIVQECSEDFYFYCNKRHNPIPMRPLLQLPPFET